MRDLSFPESPFPNPESPFPKLMQGIAREGIPHGLGPRIRRKRRPAIAPKLTEEQMMVLGTPAVEAPRRRRT